MDTPGRRVVSPSLQGSRHCPPDTFGGYIHRRPQVIGTGFTKDALQTTQLDLNVALFIHATSRAIDIPHPSGYALNFR